MKIIVHSLLLAALAACGGKDTPPPAAPEPAPAAEPAATEPAATEPAATEPATPPPGAATITPEDEATVEEAIAYFEALGQAATAAGGDCDQVATNMNEVAAQKDVPALAAKIEALEGDDGKSAALEERYAARVEAAITPLMEAVMPCQGNPAVEQAIKNALPE